MRFKLILIIAFIVLFFLVVISFYVNSNDLYVGSGNIVKTDVRESIVIPVKVHLIEVDNSLFSTERDEENVMDVFERVNAIWKQADIYFSVEKIVTEKISFEVFQNSQNNLAIVPFYTSTSGNYIDAYFMRAIGGPNGVALSNLNLIFVADITSVNDFRATSHEFGHVLGLNHVSLISRLMAQGRNGEFLSEGEQDSSRRNALILFPL